MMEIVAFVESVLAVSERDHEQTSSLLQKFESIGVCCLDDHYWVIRLSQLAIQRVPGETGSVAQVLVHKLKLHLDWAIDTDNNGAIDMTMQAIVIFSACEEMRLTVRSSHGFTETFFRLLNHNAGPRWNCPLISFVNKEVFDSRFLIEFLLNRITSLEFNLDLAKALSEACSNWSFFLNCLVDHPCAPLLVNKIVAALDECKEAANVLQLSTLLLWLTKDRQLLDNETASRILKLATTTFESSSNAEEIEACCAFFTVSCVKTTMSARLRRVLMGGLLRQLFEKNSRTVIPGVVDLIVLIFGRALLTPNFIQQHALPLETILRWLNGHLMESVRAARLLDVLFKVGFFNDPESRHCIGDEIRNVLYPGSDERLELLGGFIATTKICLASLYLSVARYTGLHLEGNTPSLNEQCSYKWAFLARRGLASDPVTLGSDPQFCNAIYSRGLIFSNDMTIFQVHPDSNFCLTHRLLIQSVKAVQDKLEFYILHRQQELHLTYSAQADEYEKNMVLQLSDQAKQLESQLHTRGNELLSLQFRYSEESSKVLEYYGLSHEWLAQKGVILGELRGLSKALVTDLPDTRTIRSYLDMLVTEVEVLRQLSESSTLKNKELIKRIADLEERLIFASEESRVYRETCESQAQQLRGAQEKENQLASHISVLNSHVAGMETKYLAQVDKINSLNDQLISTEGRMHGAVNQYHETREALAKAQLTEGQLRLELQSSRSLLEIRDQQIDSLKSQIQDLNTRLHL